MISVIMPAYNEEKNIRKAIESIIQQTNKDYELIIVNDGSEDRTADIVQSLVEQYPKIVFLNPNKKIGKVAAYNLASKYVHGDWIYFMGADDTLPLNSFEIWEKKVSSLNPEKKIALRGRLKMVSENKKYDGLVLPKNRKRMNFSGPITLLSKSMHQFILPIPEHLPNEDNWWSLCIKYFADEKLCIDDIIVFYNVHQGNSISRNDSFSNFTEKYHRRYILRKDFIDKYIDKLSDTEVKNLKNELYCEQLRYEKKSFKILRIKNIQKFAKLRMFMLSSPVLYRIKLGLDRFLLGH